MLAPHTHPFPFHALPPVLQASCSSDDGPALNETVPTDRGRLTRKERQRGLTAFRKYDTDGSGQIDKHELVVVAKALELHTVVDNVDLMSSIDALMDKVDTDGDGLLDLEVRAVVRDCSVFLPQSRSSSSPYLNTFLAAVQHHCRAHAFACRAVLVHAPCT